MKTKKLSIVITKAVRLAGIVFALAVNMANAQHLDPATGLPVGAGSDILNPATGLPASVNPLTGSPLSTQDGLSEDSSGTVACTINVSAVRNLIDEGRFDEALQRCLTYQSQPKDEQWSLMLFSAWAELGRRYPPAEQVLRKIRDDDTRQFSVTGGGSLVLFNEVASLNRELQDKEATCALFKQIWKQTPSLACYFYPVAEDSLMSQGEYQMCLNCIGDPQARFDSYRNGLEVQNGLHQTMLEECKKSSLPQPLQLPDMRPEATNNFVGQVCHLLKFLVATGNQAEARKIRDLAMALVDDPRLSSTVNAAAENTKRGMVFLPVTNLPPQGMSNHSLAEGGLGLAMATGSIANMPPLVKVRALTANGQYDQALQCILGLFGAHNTALKETALTLPDRIESIPLLKTVLPDWTELARIYSPAQESMIEIRDRDTRKFTQTWDDARLFQEVFELNESLGDGDTTYSLFQQLEKHNPSVAHSCYYFCMEPMLIQRGDYKTCLAYIGDPEAKFKQYRFCFDMALKSFKKVNESWEKSSKQLVETHRQHGWPMPPRRPQTSLRYESGVKNQNRLFVGEVSRLIEILVATGHKADAENIRDQAVAVLADPRLQSAVSDAEAKIRQIRANAGRLSK